MTTTLATINTNQIQPVIDLVTNAVTSQNTKQAYRSRILRDERGYTRQSLVMQSRHVGYVTYERRGLQEQCRWVSRRMIAG
jgi:hypothetical protein